MRMRHYSKLAIWSTKKRLKHLNKMLEHLRKYENNAPLTGSKQSRDENAVAKSARTQINRALHFTSHYMACAGVRSEMNYPDPNGEETHKIDLVKNLFNADQYHGSMSAPVGLIEQAAGVYEHDVPAAWRRTLNPFWWFGRLLVWIAHVPFFLLQAAGFNSEKAEQSMIGKLVSLAFALTTFIAAVLAITDRLGFLGQLKSFLNLST